jgi:hypothetical protein
LLCQGDRSAEVGVSELTLGNLISVDTVSDHCGEKNKPLNNITYEFMIKDIWHWLIHYTSIMLDFVVCELHFQNLGMEVKSTPFLSSAFLRLWSSVSALVVLLD